MSIRFRLFATASVAALVCGISTVASADELFSFKPSGQPAVSKMNGKLGAFGGTNNGDEATVGAFGAFSIPLRGSFGAQLDGMAGMADDDAFYGVGGHLFWRDPAVGLLGVYSGYSVWDSSGTKSASSPIGGVRNLDGAEVGKAGVEAEAYLSRFSLEGFAGYQFGSDHGFAGKATVAYYPMDDLRIDLNLRHLEGPGMILSAGAEWQLPKSPIAVFADGGVTEDEDWFAQAGVTVHFGAGEKSLIKRHREDDPDVDLPFNLFKVIGSGHCPPGTEVDDGSTCEHPG